MATQTKHQARRNVAARGAGFTLVELLVVIAIIGLLVGILAPSLQQAKVYARQGRVGALIKVLGTGLEMFNSEPTIGGEFPPSRWYTGPVVPGHNPYTAIGQTDATKPGTSEEPFSAYGAQTLIWGLAGADMLGTPGFQRQLNGSDGLYTIENARPRYPRFGPFVDITKLDVRNPVEGRDIYTTGQAGQLYEARSNIPVIFDDFNNPILYYRARPQGLTMAKYSYVDNAPFCNPCPTNNWDDDNRPVLDWIACPRDLQNRDGRGFESSGDNTSGFQLFIHNPKVKTLAQPHNSETFLLLSAGPDGLYGTRDDIGNFPVDLANIPAGF